MKYNSIKSTAIGPVAARTALQRENMALKARVIELERLVVCDTLTPAYNRRHFMDVLGRWCRKYASSGRYGLLFIDVDNLKTVNDKYGHSTGDLLLIAVAEALMLAVRRSDIVARVGGDEFAILLGDISAAEICDKADFVTKAVGQLEIPYQSGCLIPHVSVGFTAVEPGFTPEELLLRADRSMYAAKQAKRFSRLN